MNPVSPPHIKFENIAVEDGLSQSVVQCLIQDHIGFMWFGTQDGLNLYDGNKFTVFRNDPDDKFSICSNTYRSIYEDRKKNLWIGSIDGLSRYDRERNIFINYKNEKENNNSIADNQIRAICEDGNGNLWIGTYDGGLNRYNEEKDCFENYRPEASPETASRKKRVNSLLNDSNGNLWVGTWGGGVMIFDFDKKKFTDVKLADGFPENSKIDRVNHINEDKEGNIYVATNYGLFIKGRNDNGFEHLIHDPNSKFSISEDLVAYIFTDSRGNVWVGTRESGLNLFDPVERKFYNYKKEIDNPGSLSSNSIYCMTEDRSGIIWIGTFGNGIDRFDRNTRNMKHYFSEPHNPNSLSSNIVFSACEDSEGILWIGTRDEGLNRIDRENNKFTAFKNDVNDPESLSNNNVTTIIDGDENTLWIGTADGGLNKLDKRTRKFRNFRNDKPGKKNLGHDSITSIVKCDNGELWLGSIGGGLNRFDTVTEKFISYTNDPSDKYSISSNRVRALLKESDDILWIGTEFGGLNKFIISEQKFYNFKKESGINESLSDNNIISIFMDSSGYIWLGTLGGGIRRFDKETSEFKKYSVKDGLPNDYVVGIIEDNEKNIWFSTNYGLSRFDPVSEKFRNYDVRDGFQSNEFNQGAYLKLNNGDLLFGGINGFNIFSPGDIKDNKNIPVTVITNFLIFNKPAEIGKNGSVLKKAITVEDEIILSYRESVFSFEFASLDYNIPSKNQYSYKMEGFDKEWVFAGNRGFATYTNLDPGEYLFRVRGSNNDGVWDEKGRSLKIKITPPFWKTLWFKGLGVLAVAGTAGSVYSNKLKKIQQEQKAQAEFTKRLLEVQESDRKRISAELHDSIGNDLLITKNKLQMSLKNPEDIKSVVDNLNEVSDIISDTLKDVREISYSLHPYQIERLGLSKAIKSITDRAAKSTGISFIFNSDNDIDKVLDPEVEISLYRIVQECINNIIKHSKAEGVILNISRSGKSLSVLISDNGVGFSYDKIKGNSSKHGFGLKGITERVKLFNGSCEIRSAPQNGTEIKLTVPFHK